MRAAVAAVALLAASPGLAETESTFGAETFTLTNGMQVVVVPNHRAPLVHHAVWYKVGAADEPAGQSGIAHMVEHLMFKGTESVPDGEFSSIVARNGGNDNAFTSQDYTGYYQNIAADRLQLVMRLEADRMVNLEFDDNEFELEREVVLEERRSRVGNEPGALFREQAAAAQYLNHPYGVPVIGWEHEIREYTRDDAVAFYRTHYAPNNAVLVVAGDVTAAELEPLAEATYGQLAARPVPARARPVEPPQLAPRRLEMRHPRVTDREWSRGWLAPSYAADAGGVSLPLDVLSTVLGSSPTGRLYRALVVEREIATSAGAWYSGMGLDYGRFAVHVSPKSGVPVAEVEAAVEAEIARLIADGVSEEELERAKFGIRAFTVYSRDSLGMLARIFGAAMTAGLTVEDVERWPDEAAAVTGEQVVAAARAVLVPETSVTALLLPEDDAETAP